VGLGNDEDAEVLLGEDPDAPGLGEGVEGFPLDFGRELDDPEVLVLDPDV
jgi:hypothetical protein